jgi:hypothetical protein
MFRNPEGNPLLVDTIMLEMVVEEPNITLLLNTAVHAVEKSDPDTIASVRAYCAQNETSYEIAAPVFIDASGDGVVGFLAGAAFRIGSEASSEFGELFAPEKESNELLGHSIYFYSKDTGRPVTFVPPSFALKDITRIPRWRDIKFNDTGCRLWWLEWGGDLDTIHDSETIKWELWRVAYGVWNHIKNSGQFPDAANLTLEWVGTIPGKRESRRFEGDHMVIQQDLVEQRLHPDAVSYGGWAIDLHPSDGVYSARAGCQQWHSKGVFQIPYRAMYSRNITNLFLAGRIISASHIAFGSTRVMATCAHGGQSVGAAAAICAREGLKPRDLLAPALMAELQRNLLRAGQFIPGVALEDSENLASTATVTASSELKLSSLPRGGGTLRLDESWAMMIPVQPGAMPSVEFLLDVDAATTLQAELRVSSKTANHTPDVTLATREVNLVPGKGIRLPLHFDTSIDAPRYAFVCLMANPEVFVHLSDKLVTGILSVSQKYNRAVAKSPRQEPPPGTGIESFEYWLPQRRPDGKNFAMTIDPPIAAFGAANLQNGFARPTDQPNAWVADFADKEATLQISWGKPQKISRIELCFDTDFDHPMESVLLGHPERVMPYCVTEVVVAEGSGDKRVLASISENHHSRRVIRLEAPVTTDSLEIRLTSPDDRLPASLLEVRCYA